MLPELFNTIFSLLGGGGGVKEMEKVNKRKMVTHKALVPRLILNACCITSIMLFLS